MINFARRLLERNQFVRFIVVGGLNTLFGFAVYSAAILVGGPVWVALAAGNVAGTAFNFVTTGGYVFRSMVLARFPRFASVYLVMYLCNWMLIRWLSPLIPDPIIAQAILTPPMTLISYVLMKRLVFQSPPPRNVNPGGREI
jgi:putative flippase GtrA